MSSGATGLTQIVAALLTGGLLSSVSDAIKERRRSKKDRDDAPGRLQARSVKSAAEAVEVLDTALEHATEEMARLRAEVAERDNQIQAMRAELDRSLELARTQAGQIADLSNQVTLLTAQVEQLSSNRKES